MTESPFDPGRPGSARRAPSDVLLAAALGGLLALTVPSCAQDPDNDGPPRETGEQTGEILSETVDPDMTLEAFTTECDARSGKVETHPHCGGANTCKGLSYDVDTQVLMEHTCRGLNTCTGYSCVVP